MIYINENREILCPRCHGNGTFDIINRKNTDETYYICNSCEVLTNDLDKLKKYIFIGGMLKFYIEKIKGDIFFRNEYIDTGLVAKVDEKDKFEYTSDITGMSDDDCSWEEAEILNVIYPIGTVVRLKDEKGKMSEIYYMITDRFVLKDANSKEYYEYKAGIYPIGSLPDGKGVLFNNEDIERLEFEGYKTEMDRELVRSIEKKLKEQGIVKHGNVKNK